MLTKDQMLSIERPQPRCTNCDAPIAELDRHPTCLVVDGEAEPKRHDYCPECWEKIKTETYDSYWQTRPIKKEKQMPKLTRREKAVVARALFESLWEQRDREDVDSHLYFLSHLLLKWGGLRWKRNATDAEGREVIVFENPISGDSIEIRSVDLNDEAITAIQERIEAFLREHAPEKSLTM